MHTSENPIQMFSFVHCLLGLMCTWRICAGAGLYGGMEVLDRAGELCDVDRN